MNMCSGRLHCSGRILALLIAVAPAVAPASAEPTAPLDAAIEFLAAQPAEAADEIPVHLQVVADDFWPRRVVAWNNDQPLRRVTLSPEQSRMLAEHGVLQVLSVPRDIGELRLEVHLSRSDDPAAAIDLVRARSLSPAGMHDAAALDIELRRSAWRAWRLGLDVQPQAAVQASHLLADARFQLARGRALDAAIVLTRMQAEPTGPALLLLGDARQALTLDPTAQWRAAAARGDAVGRAQAALRMAELEFGAGRAGEARYWLSRASGQLPEAEQARLHALRINLGLIESVELTDEWLQWGSVALASYNQVTQRGERPAFGPLERLAALEMRDELGWSVRDHANLALGYRYLQQRLPEQARAAFARVRAKGPYSSAGRLGLGWAQITPAGGDSYAEGNAPGAQPLLRPRGDQALAAARRATPFRTASGVAHGALAERLQRALVPWTELIGADPLDPAVQEAMLAIPYALGHLGAHEDAWERTRQSIEILGRLEQSLQRALSALDPAQLNTLLPQESGGVWPAGFEALGGLRWWRQNQWPANFFMARLLAEQPVQQQIRHCAQLTAVSHALGAAGNLGLQARFEPALTTCRQELLVRTRGTLAQWRNRVSAYLGEAHLAVARMHDVNRPVLAVGGGS